MMKKIISFLFFALLTLTSCIETEYEFILNPDGSGKVNIKTITDSDPMGMGGDKIANAEKEITKMLWDTEGFDAWDNVSYKFNKDSSKMTILATAYFADFTKIPDKTIQLPLTYTKNGNTGTIKFIDDFMSQYNQGMNNQTSEEQSKMTEEEIQELIKEKKKQFKMTQSFMGAFFSGFSVKAKFAIPGEIKDNRGFTKTATNSIELKLDGSQIPDLFKLVENDEQFWRNNALKGESAANDEFFGRDTNKYKALEKMFGTKEIPSCSFELASKPAFNFTSEYNKAKKNYEALKVKYPKKEESFQYDTNPENENGTEVK